MSCSPAPDRDVTQSGPECDAQLRAQCAAVHEDFESCHELDVGTCVPGNNSTEWFCACTDELSQTPLAHPAGHWLL